MFLFILGIISFLCAGYGKSIELWSYNLDHFSSSENWEKNFAVLSRLPDISCDLTKGSCDNFCCMDDDCDEWQKQSFQCDRNDKNPCHKVLSNFDCACGSLENPEWFPMFCIVLRNPIYLGEFYKSVPKIEDFQTFKSVVKKQKNTLYHYDYFEKVDVGSSTNYKYGSPVFTFTLNVSEFPVISPLLQQVAVENLHQACVFDSVKFGKNKLSSCLTEVSKEFCDSNPLLGIELYMLQSESKKLFGIAPFILKHLEFLEGNEVSLQMKCSILAKESRRYGKKQIIVLYINHTQSCSNDFISYKRYWNDNVCHNVLISNSLKFQVKGSNITSVHAEFYISNVNVEDEFPMNVSNKFNKLTYVRQDFKNTFSNSVNYSPLNLNSRKNMSFFNRGYFIGEKLNFGYRNSSSHDFMTWIPGTLAVFTNGGNCEHSTPIEFGFNYIANCLLHKKFSTCKQLRNFTEDKFDGLIKGDSLAPYSNYENPQEEVVPILSSSIDAAPRLNYLLDLHSAKCLIQTGQDITIQYTSVYTKTGFPVHRIIGVRVNRIFENVSVGSFEGLLTSRAAFSFVSSYNVTLSSIFWSKIHSPELSENAWLKILNAFDGETDEEITVWSITIVIAILGFLASSFYIDIDTDNLPNFREMTRTRILQEEVVDFCVSHSEPKKLKDGLPLTGKFIDGMLGLSDNSIIIKKLSMMPQDKLFVDEEFPADSTSLYFSHSPGENFLNVEWKRPHELIDNPYLFVDGTCRRDVKQGILGNCWFLSACAAIATRQDLIEKVIDPSQLLFGEGYRGILLINFWRFSEWVTVNIDDRLPTKKGNLIFASCINEHEFWLAMIEKAYAKLHGSYEALIGGQALEAFVDLTGGMAERICITPDCFKQLTAMHAHGAFITCSRKSEDKHHTNCRRHVPKANGLIEGHAYTVTYVTTIQLLNGEIVELVRLRNPWGDAIEWDGAWSDKSNKWNDVSDYDKKRLAILAMEDGEFWMAFEDFQAEFEDITVATIGPDFNQDGLPDTPLEVGIIKSSWKKGINAGGCRNDPEKFALNPQYLLHLNESEELKSNENFSVLIGLMQEHRRSEKNRRLALVPIAFFIYKTDSPLERLEAEYFFCIPEEAKSGDFTDSREIIHRTDLKSGFYVIIPATFHPDIETNFMIRIFALRPFTFREIANDQI